MRVGEDQRGEKGRKERGRDKVRAIKGREGTFICLKCVLYKLDKEAETRGRKYERKRETGREEEKERKEEDKKRMHIYGRKE